jgi:hypothetical protein
LVAKPDGTGERQFLLLFEADHEALSYLSIHAPEVSDRFVVESLPSFQIKDVLKRWGFAGVGLVGDPRVPEVEFVTRDRFPLS